MNADEAISHRDPAADAVLMDAFLHGDRDATATIRSWVARIVRARAWRLRQDDDLVQDVIIALIDALTADRFEGRSSLRTYVERIAKYQCIDALRRERRRRTVSWEESGEPEPPADDDPGERVEASDEVRVAFAVLEQLPPACRELLQRVLAREEPYERLATESGVAVGTIKSRVARCRERAQALRDRMRRDRSPWWRGGAA